MNIEAKINRIVPGDGNLKAYASVNLDGVFAVHGIKVMEGSKGMFVNMPSYKSGDKYHDVCFPVTKEFREKLNDAILTSYTQTVAHLMDKNQNQDQGEDQNENFDEAEQVSAIKMAM